MKSWWIRTEGSKTVLELRDIPAPEPGEGEIVIRVHTASLNRGQFIVAGTFFHGGSSKPGGTDAAGTVHAVGQGVTSVKPGDRVMGRTKGRGGGQAEYALMEAHQVIPMPERLSWDQAGAIPAVFLVTYDMLYPYGKLKRGEWLLVTAASSGVGVASIQAGKAMGANVIGTSGSAQKLEKLNSIGLDVGIETRRGDFADKVKEATGEKGADLAVNCVGGSVFSECMRALAHKGRLATVGYVDGVMKSEIDLEALHANRFELFGVSNSRLGPEDRAATVRGFVRDLLPAFADGRIVPVIDKVFPFNALPAAKDYMESDRQVGKIVIRVLEP